MSAYQPVPVTVAQKISEEFEKDQVVILSYDRKHNLTHTTTYGVTAFDKENAAASGEIVAKAIGCDLSRKQPFEDFHDDYDPALYKEAKELIQKLFNRRDGSDWAIQQMERFLKIAGGLHPRRA